MSPIDQVLAAACALDASGKAPSLALIKSRLGNKFPMPILIQGLQQFKSMPKAERERLAALSIPEVEEQKPTEPVPLSVTTLAAQLTELQKGFEQAIALKNTEIMQLTNELIELKQRVNQLELQGKSV
ncbi:hypothetical protein HRJ35_10030 [Shewanella oneidensis MR-1]|uniref:KfrA N-terminal DNA-binding domain-containing protein n=1 Tax=Shewanella oneidensis (strain ATCC 700550 / JCM 31522 / CIP 106686 / LMG 19005 / NCIMB 14063 / MR-1) TaxID=211586 RepID=Q8EGJ1_SHEON|nr:hypothetical protein [Shewanella oneidensis]AAN54667.1 uncharacterized protein SO_1611 [Shewanella oneidensis MR-1]MDX5996583.1 hypothetical protein [Shewanella oneidensis]MEE2028354.1 hypothetical protein [Shewanella oneidensis]QKG96317.1 hypothetical protein HRJ35_10030 [Shewanella oneidensis MR-1]